MNHQIVLHNRVAYPLLIAAFLFLFGASDSSSIWAQSKSQWTPSQRIPGYDDETKAPLLVADSNRTIHAFNVQSIGEESKAIFYSTWTSANSWSRPIDILVGPKIRLQDVELDTQGIFHLIFFNGTEVGANIFYTYAPAIHAGNAHAWARPILVGPNAAVPNQAKLELDSNNSLFIVYSGLVDGRGLYSVDSVDNGRSWSEPTLAYLEYAEDVSLGALYLEMDESDRLHAAWNINSSSGNGEVVYYVQLDTVTQTWATPIKIATVEDYEADWPSVGVWRDMVIVVYQNGGPATRWTRVSRDGGKTWGPAIRPFPHVGEYGHAEMVTDSAGGLHMILGNRQGDQNHGMWYSKWQNDQWSPLKPIVSGPVSKVPGEGFDPHVPQLVVSQGNVLFAAWSNDHGFNGGWFSTLQLDAPELPVENLPAIPFDSAVVTTATPSSTATPTLTPTPFPTVVLQDFSNKPTGLTFDNPAMPIVWGSIPVGLFVLTILIISNKRRLRF